MLFSQLANTTMIPIHKTGRFSRFYAVASPDNSADILAKFAKQDARIRPVAHPENMGLSAARNTGLEQARGKWILFVDGDDCIHPQLLEYTLALAEQHNADLVSFDYERVAEDFCLCTDNAAQVADSRHKLTVEALYHRKKRGRWVIHGSACAQLYKRESSPRLYSFIYQAER